MVRIHYPRRGKLFPGGRREIHPGRIGIDRIDTTQKVVFGKAEEMQFCVHLISFPRRTPRDASGANWN